MRLCVVALGTFILSVTLASPEANAQAASAPTSSVIRVSAMGGLGWPPAPVEHNLASHLGLSINRGAHDLTLRLAETIHFEILGPDIEGSGETALLYGVRSRASRSWIRASAGIGRVRLGRDCDQILLCALYGYPRETSRHWGFAWQADAVWALAASFGLGAALLGNVNARKSFAAVTVAVHVGQLR